MGILNLLKEKLSRHSSGMRNELSPPEKAINWIKNNRIAGAGIRPFHIANVPSQEATGFTIPTLYRWGEKDLAIDLARWEGSVQRPDGAVCGVNNMPYTFDTAMAIHGFLAVVDDVPELEDNLRRACDYVENHIKPDGEIVTDTYDLWYVAGELLSEYGNLYILPPMLHAGQKLSVPRYIEAAKRGMNYFRKKPDLVEFKPSITTLSHYFGYMMEALVDLGELDLAKKGLRSAAAVQKKNGAIPAYPGVNWVCSTGMAQLAIAWYKIGDKEPADKAMAYLERLQNASGGFYGSYGKGAKYLPREEIAWGAKFFLDAYMLRMTSEFNQGEGTIQSIEAEDGRVKELLSFLGDLNSKKTLDVGCGKGRYLRVLQSQFPKAELYGIDISEKMLDFCPKGVLTSIGSMLDIKYPDHFFDNVISVEAIEHSVNTEAAVKEMIRVLKPNGKIIIIDKNASKRGMLKIMPWEKWFTIGHLNALLTKNGVSSGYKEISYEQYSQPNGLFIAWEGTKQAGKHHIS